MLGTFINYEMTNIKSIWRGYVKIRLSQGVGVMMDCFTFILP